MTVPSASSSRCWVPPLLRAPGVSGVLTTWPWRDFEQKYRRFESGSQQTHHSTVPIWTHQPSDIALSRRQRGFESRRVRQVVSRRLKFAFRSCPTYGQYTVVDIGEHGWRRNGPVPDWNEVGCSDVLWMGIREVRGWLTLAPRKVTMKSVGYWHYSRTIRPKNASALCPPPSPIVVASFRQGGRLVTPVEANGGQVVPSGCGVEFGAGI